MTTHAELEQPAGLDRVTCQNAEIRIAGTSL